MDWTLAIKKNREALLGIVAGLIALAGGWAMDPRVWRRGSDWSSESIARRNPEDDELLMDTRSLPRRLRLAILRILRPAESALRRLIIVVAAVRTSGAPKLEQRTTLAVILPNALSLIAAMRIWCSRSA